MVNWLAILGGAAGAVVLGLVAAGRPVSGAPPAPPPPPGNGNGGIDPVISVFPSSITAPSNIFITGLQFTPFGSVNFQISGPDYQKSASINADAGGAFSVSTVISGGGAGSYSVMATDTISGEAAHASFTVDTIDEPPAPPPPADKVGVYVPMYNSNMLTGILQQADLHPSLPFIVAVNPASGVGDEYVGGTGYPGPNPAVTNALTQFESRPNILPIGYLASWYARAVDSPPEGSQFSCKSGGSCTLNNGHCDVVYSMSQNQVNTIKTQGMTCTTWYPECHGGSTTFLNFKALYVPALLNRYATVYPSVKGVMIDEFLTQSAGNQSQKQLFYQGYIDTARSLGLTNIMVNPGTLPPAFAWNMADQVSVAETSNFSTALSNAQTAFTAAGQDKMKVKVVVHGQPSLPPTSSIQNLAQYAGWIYIAENNSYQSLPPYFGQLCSILDGLA